MSGQFPQTRLRRFRQSERLRSLVKETRLEASQLILPLFIRHGKDIQRPINSMPGHYQLSIDKLPEELSKIQEVGIKNIILFGIPAEKDPIGKKSCAENGIIQQAISAIKQQFPEMIVIADVCLCEYTDHGHCGVIHRHPEKQTFYVDNDATLPLLAEQAVSYARAGADIIAPSANMDGMVQAIRQALDQHRFHQIPILSYSAKYASSMYGPFRQAAEGAPKFGDRQSYQMDIANAQEAVRECGLDITEGADMLMVKPAHTYLDVIQRIKQAYPALPLAAYHTSGEFAMIKAAAEKGWLDERKGVLEVLTAIKRAGADLIITYYAKDAAVWLNN
jgi:porphobilinogen synthase